jgi:hypothetical protein
MFCKKERRIKLIGGVVKTNAGCALTVAPGWINVDATPQALISSFPELIVKMLYKLSWSRFGTPWAIK